MTHQRGPVVVAVEATFELRRLLLRDDRPDLAIRLPNDDALGTVHLAVMGADGSPIAVASLTPGMPPFAAIPPVVRLRQMATHPEHQGTGLGSDLFGAAVTYAGTHGFHTMWAEARNTAVRFYARQGMQPVEGRTHAVLGVSYVDMVLALSDPPPSAVTASA